ncbi:MAG: hypothetical protein IJ174_00720 [Clostridia bacterium]|nr:hypothetical protein [Clostridia bacterium]
MKKMLKTFCTMILCCALLTGITLPNAYAEESFKTWLALDTDSSERFLTVPSGKKAADLVWNMNKAYRISLDVLRNVTPVYEAYRGTFVNRFGLEPQGGSKLRSTPDMANNKNVIGAIHGDESVYLYFSVVNQYGHRWYYAVTASGIEGFIHSSRIQEFD